MKKENTRFLFIIGGLIAVQVAVLAFLGQPAICACGTIKLWVSDVLSSDMSQHLTDWYTFSHIIHGIIFYGLLSWLFPKLSVWQKLAIAAGAEIAWEIAENTPWVIEAYRKQALAQGYVGDSILNSVLDTFSMMLGFFLARKLPMWLTISLVVAMEVGVGYAIHDNLTLNILNFIYPFDFITRWQGGV